LFLFFLVRAYFTYIVGSTPFNAYVLWTKSTAAGNILGYTPGKILFEATFLLLVGLASIETVFKGSSFKLSSSCIGIFLVVCFIIQTFGFTWPAAEKYTQSHLKGPAVESAIQKHGIIGATLAQTKVTLFGPSKPTVVRRRQAQEKVVHFEPGKPTNTEMVIQPGDKVHYINPTVPFQVPGTGKFHTISSTTLHDATGYGSLTIFGLKKKGYVQIKVVPKRS
jgi:hypothetical protein